MKGRERTKRPPKRSEVEACNLLLTGTLRLGFVAFLLGQHLDLMVVCEALDSLRFEIVEVVARHAVA
jgi:hypothetical protein